VHAHLRRTGGVAPASSHTAFVLLLLLLVLLPSALSPLSLVLSLLLVPVLALVLSLPRVRLQVLALVLVLVLVLPVLAQLLVLALSVLAQLLVLVLVLVLPPALSLLPLAAALRARRRCQRGVGADAGAGCHSRLGDNPRCLYRDHAPTIMAVPGVSPLAGWGSWFRSGLHWGLVMVMMIAGARGARMVLQCILCDRRNALVCNRPG
jgi:hypothetical protein